MIPDDLDDLPSVLVWADSLQADGDPLGELIALSCAPEPPAERIRALQRALLDPLLLPPGERPPPPPEPPAGLLDRLRGWFAPKPSPRPTRQADPPDVRLDWRHGLVRHARLSAPYDSEVRVGALTAALLRSPAARLLRELTLGLDLTDGESRGGEAVAALAAAGPLPRLRALTLGDFEYPDECEISWAKVEDVAPLWAALPNLERLFLRGADAQLGQIDAPRLRSFTLETGGLPAAAARAVATGHLPAIEALELWFGQPGYDGDATLADVAPLLERTDLPHLRRLGLKNHELGDELVLAVADAPLVRQLTHLDLSMSAFGDRGAEALLRLAHLEHLDVSDAYLSAGMVERLRAVFGERLRADGLRGAAEAPEDRYAMVGE